MTERSRRGMVDTTHVIAEEFVLAEVAKGDLGRQEKCFGSLATGSGGKHRAGTETCNIKYLSDYHQPELNTLREVVADSIDCESEINFR